jgi:hypothetical protein
MSRTQRRVSNRNAITVSYVYIAESCAVTNVLVLDISVVKAFESALRLLRAQGVGR